MRHRFMRFPGGKPKAVTFSYDDGVREDIRLAEVLDRYGLKGTFNLNSGLWGEDTNGRRLSPAEIRQYIIDKGHEVALHGKHHLANGSVSVIDGIQDVLNCRLEMESAFGRILRGMAYPNSGVTRFANNTDYQKVRQYLIELDIAYSRTLGGDNKRFEMPEDWYAWMPTAHHNNPEIFEYIDAFLQLDFTQISTAGLRPRLFYIWGHSYEFDRKNNWEHLEKICTLLSGKEDIWYATNMEIYNYNQAYNALQFSADGTIVYNPTLYTVWFAIGKKDYCIQPGETMTLPK